MKTKFLVPLLIAIVVAGGLLIAHAENAGGPLALAGHGKFLQRIARKLHLTDDQKTQIKAVLTADKDPITSLLTRLHAAHKQLRAAIQAPDATEDSVRKAADNLAVVESDLAVERLKLHNKIAPVLTPDQKLQITVLEDQLDTFLDGVIARVGAALSH